MGSDYQAAQPRCLDRSRPLGSGLDPVMRLVVHDFPGHGFPLSLSRRLAQLGHEVLHLYSGDYPSPRAFAPSLGESGLTLDAVAERGLYASPNPLWRLWDDRRYAAALVRRVAAFQPEIILGGNGPLAAQARLLDYSRQQQIPFVFWLQDIYGRAFGGIVRKRFGRLLGGPVGGFFSRWERQLWRQSQSIIAISSDFALALTAAGIAQERIAIIENWAVREDFVAPAPEVTAAWVAKHGLGGRRLIVYAGTLGFKHNPRLLVRVAAALADYPSDPPTTGVTLVVASEGRGRSLLEAEKQRLGLDCLHLLDYLPQPEFSACLAAAEFCLVQLEADAGSYSVPSKILAYAAAGRSILAAIPAENLAARLVVQNGLGEVVPPDQDEEFCRRVFEWLDQPTLLAQYSDNSRHYANIAFDLPAISERFLHRLSAARPRAFSTFTKPIQ
ncbi:MAG: glycosyltransferase family 4 protein [Alphaproteobacteria bacterium]|nr:glycosyltransferase family 4 protein [Alphaproteobacteria bacterium]